MKNKIVKRILIILGIVIGVTGLTTISVQTTNKFIENRKVQKIEKAKEKKIREEKEAEKERRKIALWCVQNLEGPEIKEIKVGPVTKLGIAGTGGTSIDVEINNMKNNSISFIVDSEDLVPKAGTFDPHSEYDFTKKTDKSKNLKGIKVEQWKES